MKLIFCIILTLVSSFLSASDEKGYIPFQYVEGLILIHCNIDGHSGAYVWDTGASDILIHDQSISSDATAFETENGVVYGESFAISNIKIGEFTRENVKAFKMDLSTIQEYLSIEINGVIGGALFDDVLIQLDFARQVMTLSSNANSLKLESGIPFKMYHDTPVINVNIGGDVHYFILDSGATSHFVDTSVVKRYGSLFYKEEKGQVSTTTASGISTMSRYTATQLSIKDITLHNQKMVAGDFKSMIDDIEISGLISISQLAQGVMYFDLKNNVLYL